jgi:glycyl-tRNA synthetase beta chain
LKSLSGEFFLEIGCEEIPARYLPDLSRNLALKMVEFLKKNRLKWKEGETRQFFTSRRLVFLAPGLPLRQPDLRETVTGPPRKVAYDDQGHPTQAAKSFAEKNGVKIEDLTVTQTAKGDYISTVKSRKGDSSYDILSRDLAGVILSVDLPRAMYWQTPADPHFMRPIRWICAIFAGRPVRFRMGDVKSGSFTYGHRILSPSRIAVKDFVSYEGAMKRSGVVLDPKIRREKIESESKVLAEKNKANILEDEKLLDIHVCLSEHPTPVVGAFDRAYLKLPQEILVTVMRDHQKYFSLLDKRDGRLLPGFLAVIDNASDRLGFIRRSHERVLRARLADAEFFWDTDLRISLEDRRPMLDKVVFQEKLGSYGEKACRIEALAEWIVDSSKSAVDRGHLKKSAQLCKCDLTAQMVKEFPELQGVVGGLYARAQGYPVEISEAIYEHYMPETLEAATPPSRIGAILSMADRMDTIAGSFTLGHRPSGSKDPFGLRRLAYGVIKVTLDKKISIDLSQLIKKSVELQSKAGAEDTTETISAMKGFFRDHIAYVLANPVLYGRESAVLRDEVAAVASTDDWDLNDLRARLEALSEIRKRENFDSLAASFKRIKNIIRKSGVSVEGKAAQVEPGLLEQEEEKALYMAIQELKEKVAPLRARQQYTAILESIAAVGAVVDRFFDKVLVNADNEAVRNNRFNLLLDLYQEFIRVADFSELQPASGSPQ